MRHISRVICQEMFDLPRLVDMAGYPPRSCRLQLPGVQAQILTWARATMLEKHYQG